MIQEAAPWVVGAIFTAVGSAFAALIRGDLVIGKSHREIVEILREENRLLRSERDDLRERLWPAIQTVDRAIGVASTATAAGRRMRGG